MKRMNPRAANLVGFLILLAPLLITQAVGFSIAQLKPSAHDLEFEYTEAFHVQGLTGWYESYTEDYSETGHYVVDFSGNVATVHATVQWSFKSYDEGYLDTSQSGNPAYTFTYSIDDGHYIAGTDQDFNTTGMNVWFHVPGGFKKDLASSAYLLANGSTTCSILDHDYGIGALTSTWMGKVLPAKGIKVASAGSFINPDYDNLNAAYTDTQYFTEDGFLVNIDYREHGTGIVYGYHTEYDLSWTTEITTASYARDLDGTMYFWLYWFALVVALLIWGIIGQSKNAPRLVTTRGGMLTVARGIPAGLRFEIDTPYAGLLDAFKTRTRHAKGIVYSAYDSRSIKGVGFVDADLYSGSFFGDDNAVTTMAKISRVQIAFTESTIPGTKVMEKYSIYKLSGIQNKAYNISGSLVKPISGEFIEPAMRMIAKDDKGTSDPRLAGWIKPALETDICYVATTKAEEHFAKQALAHLSSQDLMPPVVNDEALAGIGFAATSGTAGWLYGLYVHPAFRNRGIGEDLVKARLSALAQIGVTDVVTEIADWNGPARTVYAKMDHSIVGTIYMLGISPLMAKVRVTRH